MTGPTGPAPSAADRRAAAPRPARDPAKVIDAHGTPGRVPWRAVIVYLALSFGGAWAVVAPAWLAGADMWTNPGLVQTLGAAMMWTPGIAALLVVFLIQRPDRPVRELGLSLRPVRRTIGYVILAIVVCSAVVVASPLIAGAFGVPLDLASHSYAMSDPSTSGQSFPGVLASSLISTFALGIPLTALLTLGEELGWRGFLVPALRPLGALPMVLISGVIWGLWHAPLILLGYNFLDRSIGGVLLMTVMTTCLGAFMAWLRIRSESIWPSVWAHSAHNSVAIIGVLIALDATAAQRPPVQIVWPGWALYAIVSLVLFLVAGRSPRVPRWRLDGLTRRAPDDLDEDGAVRDARIEGRALAAETRVPVSPARASDAPPQTPPRP